MKHLTLLLLVLMGLQFDSAFGQSEMPDYSSYILTPPPAAEPRINSARVFGVRPGAPILYTIAASGERRRPSGGCRARPKDGTSDR